jgi:hypothetical protein
MSESVRPPTLASRMLHGQYESNNNDLGHRHAEKALRTEGDKACATAIKLALENVCHGAEVHVWLNVVSSRALLYYACLSVRNMSPKSLIIIPSRNFRGEDDSRPRKVAAKKCIFHAVVQRVCKGLARRAHVPASSCMYPPG